FVFFLLIFQYLRAKLNSKLFGSIVIGSWFLLMISIILMNQTKEAYSKPANVITADFQVITDRIGINNSIYIDGDYATFANATHALGFYLSGNFIVSNLNQADYVISRRKQFNPCLLTPHNSVMFLFDNPCQDVRNTNRKRPQ
ncbi:MAG: hypothetical protein D6675_00445, partial [Gemmatimonadetes bacterium]